MRTLLLTLLTLLPALLLSKGLPKCRKEDYRGHYLIGLKNEKLIYYRIPENATGVIEAGYLDDLGFSRP
ncbi:hypothetical protein L596_028826 [Steinernema carpocapsae]|uniref:Uncharacterized protein n=1 Tax=Steinernema carpocapsae TaxID=34508 RepID=A0A4U5LZH1_STECR|nr:hypothetical protein L596_028826 [Steinernema carpocapsae]